MKAEVQKVSLRRLAKPEEIAEGVCFLASPMSSYMCGVAMLMDGLGFYSASFLTTS
jgi:NAD(P)-dependent dehydrogenase (short-subunit alcohol dehydrogenase family)